MSWRERYLQASFRGVPFYVDRARSDFGRKTVTHEFVDRDEPYSEDLGRSARLYSVSGYLIGDDYLEQRDRLLSACENQSGAGDLVHPYYGVVRVNCVRIRTADSIDELNMLRLNMQFAESGEEIFPQISTNQTFANAANKLSAMDEAKARLLEVYDITRIPLNKVDEIRRMINDGLSLIEDSRLVVSSAASYRRIIDQAQDDVESLLNNGSDLADTFADLFAFGTFPEGLYPTGRADEYNEDNEDNPVTSESAIDQFNEFRSLWDFSPASSTDSSDGVSGFFVQSAIVMAAGLISVIEYTSLDQAEEYRDAVVSQINGLLDRDLPVDLAAAFQDLRTSVIDYIDEQGANLYRLAEIILNESAPALVLSYRLYGTVEREQDIIDRNGIEHPGFVPGGEPIEVLSDVG